MWKRILECWLNPWMRRKLLAFAVVFGVGVAAFCWGRHEAHSQIAPPQGRGVVPEGKSDYSQRVVAYIFDKFAITREDLGDYLIARFATPQRIDFLVNHKIIEHICRLKNVHITEAEINMQLKEDLRTFNVTE